MPVPDEDDLSLVLSEFARTMVTDFPIQAILDHLVLRIVDVLLVTAAGAAPEPRELFATDVGMGSMSAGDISLVAGDAGSDVVDVVCPSRTHGNVTATVNRGHFALWFPGDVLMNASSDGVELEATDRDGTTTTSRLTL